MLPGLQSALMSACTCCYVAQSRHATGLTSLQQSEVSSVQLLGREGRSCLRQRRVRSGDSRESKQEERAAGNSEARSRDRRAPTNDSSCCRQTRRGLKAGAETVASCHCCMKPRTPAASAAHATSGLGSVRRCLSWPCKTAPGRGSSSAAWTPCPARGKRKRGRSRREGWG